MKTTWRSRFLTVAVATTIITVILCACVNHVESRPSPSALEHNYPQVDLVQPYIDYDDYPDYNQGPRRRRWAFPADVYDVPCPKGQKLHNSGYRCVPDNDKEDDY